MCLLIVLQVVRDKTDQSDDIHISALDSFYHMDGTKESLQKKSVGLVSRRRCQRSQEK